MRRRDKRARSMSKSSTSQSRRKARAQSRSWSRAALLRLDPRKKTDRCARRQRPNHWTAAASLHPLPLRANFGLPSRREIGYAQRMNSREALVALNMVSHVGPVRLRQLLEKFGDPVSVLSAKKSALLSVNGINEVTAEAIASWESKIDLAGELKRIADFGCQILTLEDENYPELLRQIYDPPIVLYVKGTLAPRDKNGVAMV